MNCEPVLFNNDGKEVTYYGTDCKLKKNTTTGEPAEINGDNSICESVAEDGQKFVKCHKGNKSLEWEVDYDTHQIQACDCKSEILPDPKTGGAKKRKSVKKKKMKKSKTQRKSRKKH